VAQLLEEKSTLRLRIDISWSMHCKEDPIYVFPEMKLRSLVPNSYINESVRDLWEYINRSQIHECGNWERDGAVSFPGMHKSDLLRSASSMKCLF
jgi:hypothetical protein